MSDRLGGPLLQGLADRYRIERELGQGGMATVYLAEDLRHDRKVALKVLRPELAAVIGAARFLQEIKTTANLQHPHILGLHDSGEVEGTVFYVMPYVEGESLRDRLTREKQLPVDEAVRIAREVASALDYAHRHRVIHRDIKPENILLHDGSALVADFGIALAASRTGGGRMTETGMSLGTPHYMSPEQAMGERELDARSDVYALGCVTYEMLSGEPPFTGPTAQAIIARVVTEEPRSLTLQRKSIPPHVEAAVSQALSKLPADRFTSAAQFAEALGNPTLAGPVARTTTTRAAPRNRVPGWAPWAATGAIAVLAGWGWLRPGAEVREEPVTRFAIQFEGKGRVTDGSGSPIAVSPDGSRIVYMGQISPGGTGTALFSRAMDRDEPVLVAGTEGAIAPFFSPDGASIGFYQSGRIRRLALSGGAVVTVCESSGNGASWGPDNFIYFYEGDRLMRVPAGGGQPTLVVQADSGAFYRFPDVLADGSAMLITLVREGSPSLAAVSLPDGRLHEFGQAGMYPRWVEGGFLVFVQPDGSLFSAPFDARKFRLTGAPVPIAERVRFGPAFPGKLGVARTGTIAYLTGTTGHRQLVLATRDGRLVPVAMPPRPIAGPRISPDGNRIAFFTADFASGFAADLWTYDLRTANLSRVTFDSASAFPEWSVDGRYLVYTTTAGGRAIVRISVDGSGIADTLLAHPSSIGEVQPSKDERTIVFRDGGSGNRDVWVATRDTGWTVRPLLRTPFNERGLALSPDGSWLAYVSNESGSSDEVYVRRLEAGSGRWKVSRAGGFEPRWGASGRELYFRVGDSLMVTTMVPGPEPQFSTPRSLFYGDFDRDSNRPSYDISPDGTRFVFTRALDTSNEREMNVVLNWFAQFRKR